MTMVQTCFVTPPNASTAILTRSLIRDLAYNNTLTRPADRYVCHFHKRQRCRMDQKLNECRKRESATSDRIVHVYLCFCLCTIFFVFFGCASIHACVSVYLINVVEIVRDHTEIRWMADGLCRRSSSDDPTKSIYQRATKLFRFDFINQCFLLRSYFSSA